MKAESPADYLEIPPPEGWTTAFLGGLLEDERDIRYGIVQPGKHTDDGIPIIRVNNIRDGRIDTTEFLRVDTEIESTYKRSRLEGGEVLLSLVGTLGECAIVPPELKGWNVARAVAVIPVDQKIIDPRWITTCLRSAPLQHLMKSWATTTVQATLNLRDVRKLPIVLPPDSEINNMMEVVGSLDEKNELNRRMNRTLEELARAIFKAWFVDFEPVKAKANGATSFPGMPQNVFDQLPDTFVPSDLGPIPEGWDVGIVSDIATLSRNSITPADSSDEEFEHFSLPAFDDGAMPAVDLGDTIKSNKYRVPEGCVLVSKLNPKFPRIWMPFPLRAGRRQIASTEFLVNSPKEGWSREYLYALFTSEGFISEMIQTASGTSTSHQRVRPKEFERLEIVLPPQAIRDAYERMVEPMFARVSSNLFESQTLAEIRDALLPKLISGELRIRYKE